MKASTASPSNMRDIFCRGVSLFARARNTKRRKFIRPAKKLLSRVKSWVNKSNPNAMHYKAFLDAEISALKGKLQVAEKHYQSGITIAGRGGFKHDAALASELYGEFVLHEVSDK
jgi:hypothetical protein